MSFEVFNHEIYSYSFLWLLGYIVGAVYLLIINHKGTAGRLSYIDLIIIYFLCVLGIYYGSKAMGLLYNLVYNNDIVHEQGLSFQSLDALYGSNLLYGGVLAVVFVFLIYGKLFKVSIKKIVGIFTPFGALFVFFARLGCFFAGCCYGIPCSFGYVFPLNSYNAPGGIRLFPTQMTEAVFGLVLFIVMLFMQKRLGEEKSWLTMPVFIASYSTLSFLLDFVRGDTLEYVWFLTVSQWASLAFIIAVAVWFLLYTKQNSIKHKRCANTKRGG